jgi:alkylresorcinol/alkylpyrone synthase
MLINRMGLSANIRRVPIFGLGCVAGAAGIARAADYVRAYPSQSAALVSVELCSLTIQRDDLSVANLISSGLFADGSAAVIVTGDDLNASGPEIIDTRSIFYPDTEQMMGWKVTEKGFRITLSPEVPTLIREHLGHDVDAFLADHEHVGATSEAGCCTPAAQKCWKLPRPRLIFATVNLMPRGHA